MCLPPSGGRSGRLSTNERCNGKAIYDALMAEAARTVYRACNLCEAICGLAIEVDRSQILSIRGDDADPFSRGHICPKAVALKDVHEDPNRLRHPMRRDGDSWHELSWDEAFELAAEKLASIQLRHGNDAAG